MNKPNSNIIAFTLSIVLLIGIAGCKTLTSPGKSTALNQKTETVESLVRAKSNFIAALEEIEKAKGSIDQKVYSKLVTETKDQIEGINDILPELISSKKSSKSYYKEAQQVMSEWESKSLEVLNQAKQLNG